MSSSAIGVSVLDGRNSDEFPPFRGLVVRLITGGVFVLEGRGPFGLAVVTSSQVGQMQTSSGDFTTLPSGTVVALEGSVHPNSAVGSVLYNGLPLQLRLVGPNSHLVTPPVAEFEQWVHGIQVQR